MSDVREILIRLPAESLLRFRTVCKTWCHIIDDPSFIKSHTKNQHFNHSSTILTRNPSESHRLYSFSLDTLNYTGDVPQTIDATLFKELICPDLVGFAWRLVPSCNGLILISYYDTNNPWVIWKPLIPDFHKLSQPDNDLLGSGFSCKYLWCQGSGFGYDYATDDYKVVRMHRLHRDRVTVCRTLVYSLKLGLWRRIKDCPYDIAFNAKGFERRIALEIRQRGNCA